MKRGGIVSQTLHPSVRTLYCLLLLEHEVFPAQSYHQMNLLLHYAHTSTRLVQWVYLADGVQKKLKEKLILCSVYSDEHFFGALPGPAFVCVKVIFHPNANQNEPN